MFSSKQLSVRGFPDTVCPICSLTCCCKQADCKTKHKHCPAYTKRKNYKQSGGSGSKSASSQPSKSKRGTEAADAAAHPRKRSVVATTASQQPKREQSKIQQCGDISDFQGSDSVRPKLTWGSFGSGANTACATPASNSLCARIGDTDDSQLQFSQLGDEAAMPAPSFYPSTVRRRSAGSTDFERQRVGPRTQELDEHRLFERLDLTGMGYQSLSRPSSAKGFSPPLINAAIPGINFVTSGRRASTEMAHMSFESTGSSPIGVLDDTHHDHKMASLHQMYAGGLAVTSQSPSASHTAALALSSMHDTAPMRRGSGSSVRRHSGASMKRMSNGSMPGFYDAVEDSESSQRGRSPGHARLLGDGVGDSEFDLNALLAGTAAMLPAGEGYEEDAMHLPIPSATKDPFASALRRPAVTHAGSASTAVAGEHDVVAPTASSNGFVTQHSLERRRSSGGNSEVHRALGRVMADEGLDFTTEPVLRGLISFANSARPEHTNGRTDDVTSAGDSNSSHSFGSGSQLPAPGGSSASSATPAHSLAMANQQAFAAQRAASVGSGLSGATAGTASAHHHQSASDPMALHHQHVPMSHMPLHNIGLYGSGLAPSPPHVEDEQLPYEDDIAMGFDDTDDTPQAGSHGLGGGYGRSQSNDGLFLHTSTSQAGRGVSPASSTMGAMQVVAYDRKLADVRQKHVNRVRTLAKYLTNSDSDRALRVQAAMSASMQELDAINAARVRLKQFLTTLSQGVLSNSSPPQTSASSAAGRSGDALSTVTVSVGHNNQHQTAQGRATAVAMDGMDRRPVAGSGLADLLSNNDDGIDDLLELDTPDGQPNGSSMLEEFDLMFGEAPPPIRDHTPNQRRGSSGTPLRMHTPNLRSTPRDLDRPVKSRSGSVCSPYRPPSVASMGSDSAGSVEMAERSDRITPIRQLRSITPVSILPRGHGSHNSHIRVPASSDDTVVISLSGSPESHARGQRHRHASPCPTAQSPSRSSRGFSCSRPKNPQAEWRYKILIGYACSFLSIAAGGLLLGLSA